jgi:hypothetical protein
MRILESEKKSQQLSKHTTRELLLCEIFKKTHRLLSLSHVFFFESQTLLISHTHGIRNTKRGEQVIQIWGSYRW